LLPAQTGLSSTSAALSNQAFFKDVTSAAPDPKGARRYDLHQQSEADRASFNPIGFTTAPMMERGVGLQDMVLPPRQLADAAVQCYFQLFHPLLPILHRPTLMSEYEKLWVSNRSTDSTSLSGFDLTVFYAIVNMVMALGCQRSETLHLDERDKFADELYQRSQRIISLDTLDYYSLPVVQLLLLRTLYLLYSRHAERCWSHASVAVGAAYAIGLNLPDTSSPNQLAREMHKRAWWCCVLVDRCVFPMIEHS
jgi:hypothetical protein